MLHSKRIRLSLLGLLALVALTGSAAAQEPILGEVRIFAGNFAPRGWAFCDGQLLPINQNQSLYSLLGTTYGGDGRTSFALPDLRGRSPVHPNPGSGGGELHITAGQRVGAPTEFLTSVNMPSHTHTSPTPMPRLRGSDQGEGSDTPEDHFIPTAQTDNYSTTGAPTPMANDAVTGTVLNAGGGQSFSLSAPTLAVNYIIALRGLFPSRN